MSTRRHTDREYEQQLQNLRHLLLKMAGYVEEMIAACWKGPPASRVTAVIRHDATEDDLRGDGFVQLPTA